ncbi:hypothetical protein HX891_19715 [Pseudomonas reactans]|uniref:hypothetical protein n=1 Tax=Pseudomonas reactans TaxID=117680 RepID=UPI0015BC29F9|nr:hypothetical protein [Pseudomonas reactans]NWD82616.1 hypothetical protein [Pseudomonas reactans]
MPIDSTNSQPYLPSYAASMQAQPRSAASEPPPNYEFPPAYTEKPSSNAAPQSASTPPTNLTANRISNFHTTSQAVRGMNFMSGL